MSSSISPVSTRVTLTALPTTSAGHASGVARAIEKRVHSACSDEEAIRTAQGNLSLLRRLRLLILADGKTAEIFRWFKTAADMPARPEGGMQRCGMVTTAKRFQRECCNALDAPLLVCEPVFAEAMHLLRALPEGAGCGAGAHPEWGASRRVRDRRACRSVAQIDPEIPGHADVAGRRVHRPDVGNP